MLKLVYILLSGLVCEAIGVVLLSKGLKQIGEISTITFSGVVGLIGRGASNPNILGGVALEAAFFGTLLYLMSRGDVSFVWPLTSLGFVLTTLAARFVLHEDVSILRWSGVFLIVMGAGLITYSEKLHEKRSGQVHEGATASDGADKRLEDSSDP